MYWVVKRVLFLLCAALIFCRHWWTDAKPMAEMLWSWDCPWLHPYWVFVWSRSA
jgi:hypothetical protein